MTRAAVLHCRTRRPAMMNADEKVPMTWVELRGFEPLTPSMRTRFCTHLWAWLNMSADANLQVKAFS